MEDELHINDADMAALEGLLNAQEEQVQPAPAPAADNTTMPLNAPTMPLGAAGSDVQSAGTGASVSPTPQQNIVVSEMLKGMKEGVSAPRNAANDGKESKPNEPAGLTASPPSPPKQGKPAPKQVKQVPKVEITDTDELDKLQIEPIEWLVDGFIPRGDFIVLSADPKVGKSWLCFDLALSVAEGKPFLGFKTHQHATLYCDLEERKQVVKRRLRKLRGDAPKPRDCFIAFDVPTMGNGLIDALGNVLDEHPEIALIIVDVLQKIRDDDGKKNGTLYNADYSFLTPLKEFANNRNCTVLVTHHTRKAAADDVFQKVSGSIGMTGVGDGNMMIERKRGESTPTLYYDSRTIEGGSWRIEFDKDTCRWVNLGDADSFAEKALQEAYEHSPVVRTIRELTKGRGFDGWTGTWIEFLTAGREITGREIAPSTVACGKIVRGLSRKLEENDGIGFKANRNGNQRTVSFYRVEKPDADETEAVQGCLDFDAVITDDD